MKLPIIEFPSKMFHFVGGHAFAEASDLNNKHLQKLYDDACDVGFSIVSSKSKRSVVFHMVQEVRTAGEITGWKYLPTPDSIRDVPECKDLMAFVYND